MTDSATEQNTRPPLTRWERVKEAVTRWAEKKFNPQEADEDIFVPFEPMVEVVDFSFLSASEQQEDIEKLVNKINFSFSFNTQKSLANKICLIKVLKFDIEKTDFYKCLQDEELKIKYASISKNINKAREMLQEIPDGDESNFIKMFNLQAWLLQDLFAILLRNFNLKILISWKENKVMADAQFYKINFEAEALILAVQELKKLIVKNLSIFISNKNRRFFTRQAKFFLRAKKEYAFRSRLFMVGVFISLLLVVAWAFNLHCQWDWLQQADACGKLSSLKDINLYPFLYLLLGKMTVAISLLAFFAACLRGYFANSHNRSVNHHRYNALVTFQHFNKSHRNNDYLVRKAIDTTFDHLPTGFTKLQSDKGEEKISVADILRVLGNKQG